MFTSIRTRWHVDASQRLAVVATSATCAVLLIWAAAATYSAWEASRRLAEADARVQYLSHAARASELSLLRNKELNRVFGRLQPYQRNAANYINQQYLHRFETRENTIAVFLANNTKRPLWWSFEIRFLNEFGFVTGVYRDSRSTQPLAVDEECVSEGELEFQYGEPVYYSVTFLGEPDES